MFLVDSYVDPHAGTEKQLFHLISNIGKFQYKPHLTLLRPSGYIEKNGFPCEVTVLRIGKLMKLQSILDICRYGMKIRESGYRVVHIFFNDASILAPVILRACGLKVIISRRDMGYWYNRTNLPFLRINALFLNAVVTNCNAVKQVTHKKEHVPLSKIHVIFNGFTTKEAHETNALSNPLGQLGVNLRIVGIVANIRPIKRIADLVKAFAIVRETLTDITLIIVGAGDTSNLLQLAMKLGISDAIVFAGKQEDTKAYIKQFDVAVLCSESEGLSNSIIEYMYYGIPVVCTRTGGNVELIENEKNGFLYDVGDVYELAKKIRILLEDKALAEKYRSESAKIIHEICNMERMVEAHSNLYSTFLR